MRLKTEKFLLYILARFGSKERVHTVSPVGDREWDKMKTVSSRHIYDYIKVVLVLLLHAALCGSICVTKSCTWYLVTGRQWQCVLGDRINISRGLNLLNSLSPWTSQQQVRPGCWAVRVTCITTSSPTSGTAGWTPGLWWTLPGPQSPSAAYITLLWGRIGWDTHQTYS